MFQINGNLDIDSITYEDLVLCTEYWEQGSQQGGEWSSLLNGHSTSRFGNHTQ